MRAEDHPYLAIIVKPTYACNLSCDYCSVEGQDTSQRMSLQTVDMLFERVTAFCGTERTIYLIWHGGEPLLMGPAFYDYIGKKTKEYKGFQIINSLQSNAILLNSAFIDVIVKYRFRFSTSIDGPSELHDRSRKDKYGRPTFEQVMGSVSLLKAKGIPVGAITVLNRMNKKAMPEIYRFFNDAQIHLRINPVQLHGKAAQNYQKVAISPKSYGQEMIKVFDMWYHDSNTKIMLDPFRIIIGNIITGTIHSCDFRRRCHLEVISVAPTGNIYPCGQFTGNDDYYLGNIYNNGFSEIMASPGMSKLLKRIPENIRACSQCKYTEICHCGCTASAVCRNGNIMQPDFYCLGRKMLFQHVINTVQADIDQAIKIGESISQEPWAT